MYPVGTWFIFQRTKWNFIMIGEINIGWNCYNCNAKIKVCSVTFNCNAPTLMVAFRFCPYPSVGPHYRNGKGEPSSVNRAIEFISIKQKKITKEMAPYSIYVACLSVCLSVLPIYLKFVSCWLRCFFLFQSVHS